MPTRDVVVIGASAGGIDAVCDVLSGIPETYSGVIAIVVHVAPTGGAALPNIFTRCGHLRVSLAVDGEPLASGRGYVCAADRHLLLGDGEILLRRGPKENGYRPGIDPLFRSAAHYFGPRAVGIVLSGMLSDGASGLDTIRRQGGIGIVQEPSDASFGDMPTHAIDEGGADYILPAREIGPLLVHLAHEEVAVSGSAFGETLRTEVALMETDDAVVERDHPGDPSPWPCPDCNGVLWEIDDGDVLRFRCRVGHAWAASSLLAEQGEAVEAALWVALRALEDRTDLARRMAARAEKGGHDISARRFLEDVEDLRGSVETLRRLLHYNEGRNGRPEDRTST